MPSLHLELVPEYAAVRSDAAVAFYLLLRLLPPAPPAPQSRPALNLGLVLDHSGSMAARNKMDFARQAAVFAVQQLLPSDRVSVTVFDDEVATIVPSTPAENQAAIIAALQRVRPDGSTALHAGWEEGAGQVRNHLLPEGLNRVLLLTDGLANVGKTNLDDIATDVNRLAQAGVSTTTLGVGADYNEDLLAAMARSGDGNYYYIEAPQQLADIFQTELRGLMANAGHGVRLALEPLAGTEVNDVLNDFDRDADGRLQLPNLVASVPLEVVLRLTVPPQTYCAGLCRFHLSWQDPRHGAQQQTETLSLPALAGPEWQQLAPNVLVRERVVLQQAGRCKRRATACLDQGDVGGAQRCLREAREALADLPPTAAVEQELRDLGAVESRLHRGDHVGSRKLAHYQHYVRSRSQQV